MQAPNPYAAPQAEITALPETWPRKLPAIVGVGATISFWSWLIGIVCGNITTLLLWLEWSNPADELSRLLEGLNLWVVPIPLLLGNFLLFQVPEESGAKGYFKWALILYAADWSWQIALFYEQNPESVPVLVNWLFLLGSRVSALIFFVGCLRLSTFCEDSRMIWWSKLSLFFGVCFNLLLTISDGIGLFAPNFFVDLAGAEPFWSTRLYEFLVYAPWAVWLPLLYFHGRTLWRIPAHAEVEAQKKLDPVPLSQDLTGSNHEPESV